MALDASAWLGLLSQRSRLLTLDTALTDALVVERFHGHEAVNENFRLVVDCFSASAFLDLSGLLGSAARLAIASADGGRRQWHGHVVEAAQLGSDGGLARYRITLSSWLSFLELRRNALIFQDQDVLGVLEQVFADHPEARWRHEVSEPLRRRPITTQYRETDLDFVLRLLAEEGLSFRFEHDQDGVAATSRASEGGHTLVVFDRAATHAEGNPASIRFHRIDATEQDDAISAFSQRQQLVSDASVAASWKASDVVAPAGSAEAAASEGAPALPRLEVFDADRAGRFDSASQAERRASLTLDALRLPAIQYLGSGAVRTLEAGKQYQLLEHPDGEPSFVALQVVHEAANNLGSDLARLFDSASIEAGSYRNNFLAVPAATPIVPLPRPRPTAPGLQTAIVVGTPDSALTSTRDHQVRIQFPWQRGVAPLPGGLTDTASRANPDGHAPQSERSGTWVRVAEAVAGPNHGHSFTPRIGTEVVVEFAHGDIDQPLITGQLYNGQAAPPFAAGTDSGANHPGTLSGIQTQTTDGQAASRWVLDDASGQLRHELSNTLADSRLGLGHLIDQSGAQRGAYRGQGFELASAAWGSLRAGQGLLLSSTARPQAGSTQMDVAESAGQLKAATLTAQRLHDAASQAQAGGLAANAAQQDFHRQLDPAQDGHYTGAVAGQDASKPSADQRSGGDPVERFAAPAVLLESPSAIALTTPNSAVAFAGEQLHLTAQHDAQLAAGATFAAANGDAVSLYTAEGGLKAIANHGPVSLQAHTDRLEILADQSVAVTSSTARIDILAHQKIVLQAGQSTVTLEGENITFACPGTFTVKASQHPFLDGENQPAAMPHLPVEQLQIPPQRIPFRYAYHDGEPVMGAPYTATFSDGSVRQGRLDEQGYAQWDGLKSSSATVTIGSDPRPYQRFKLPLKPDDDISDWMTS